MGPSGGRVVAHVAALVGGDKAPYQAYLTSPKVMKSHVRVRRFRLNIFRRFAGSRGRKSNNHVQAA